MSSGTLEVTLIEACDLKDVDKLGKQDPYCILSVGGRGSRSNTHTDGGTAPVWNQVFTFPNVTPDQYLCIEVFDENLVFRDVSIGTCKLALKEVIARGSQDVRLPVFTKKGNKHKGDVLLRLVFRKGALAPTAVGVVSAHGMNAPSMKKMPPKPTTGFRPGQWILPTYKDSDCWKDYESGRMLGKGTYGTTYLGMHKQTGQQVAIKVISKRRLGTPEEVEDVQREVQIMHHLKGHSNVVGLLGVYEDKSNICLVMELCSGGELFDRIVAQGKYTEKDAATVMRTIMTVVAHCHSMGVVHRDLKPENFLLADKSYTSAIRTADFGLATFFQEGQTLTDIVGSAFYIAPEVLKRCYNKEADIWSCGIILYILLSGSPPFQGAREKDIFNEVANKPLDLTSYPWSSISEPAKECVRRMLVRDPAQRATAQEILQHDWMRENGVASDNQLEVEVVKRIKGFSGMNKLKKEALKLIAGNLPVDEITGLREMFIEIDKDKSGTLTVDEFTAAVRNKGQAISQADMARLMEAADMNGDGIIDYEEFLAAMVHVSKMQREEHLKAAFEHFDKDGSGSINRTELAQALRECKLTAKQIEQIISEVDGDGDGEIDYNEFCIMMREM